ncbi:hypothetical protein NG895_13270 [Aeoliella sp. ICT_H6.2]|uniref:Uncharacterized protein n=1 Tax=Aeoliella straminimaris TaxID=2954799 RepID=A0A9X2JGX7_9BACT|nr:hypothetical protein [Aeoliella straminimaris]MCO6044877.1 hypothetical protein [Aeoliella straminimaris]
MRLALLLAWIAIPVAFGFYHYGPGQDAAENAQAGADLRLASYQSSQEDWAGVEASCSAALASLKSDDPEVAQRIRLERAKARLMAEQLPAAYDDLTSLLNELEASEEPNAELLEQTRAAMASAEYYVTWLMRLEGEPREKWELEIEAARQKYRLLAEQAVDAGDQQAAEQYTEDLEATIRLARMDLSDLEALDLPCQCKGCCSGECNCKCKKPGKKPTQGKKKAKDARGASSGPPADGIGS